MQHAQTYQQIYGVLAAIPIFLLWIYLSWVIVILAASIAASASAFEYHPPMQTLPEGAEFLGLLVVLRHFVEAQRAGSCVDPADVRAKAPYLRSAIDRRLFRRPAASRPDPARRVRRLAAHAAVWTAPTCCACTGTPITALPLHPLEEAAALGIELPPALLAMLDDLAAVLEAKLGVRLDQIYPVTASPTADTEELPA